MLLQIMAGRLVLVDEEEGMVDSRYLRGDEVIHQGDAVHFACHDVIVGKRLDR
jgi:hypothetical protein